MTIAAVITAAGSGTRLGAQLPKALVSIEGRALVAWAVLRTAQIADAVIVTAPSSHLSDFRNALAEFGEGVRVIAGGDTRQQSVAAGLEALSLSQEDIVLIHDAARAFQEPAVMAATVQAVQAGAAGAIPVLPLVDTLIGAPGPDGTIGELVDRDALRAVQTPQTFRAGIALKAHRHATNSGLTGTDDATLVRALGHRVQAVDGHEWGYKITRPGDLPLAHHIAREISGAHA